MNWGHFKKVILREELESIKELKEGTLPAASFRANVSIHITSTGSAPGLPSCKSIPFTRRAVLFLGGSARFTSRKGPANGLVELYFRSYLTNFCDPNEGKACVREAACICNNAAITFTRATGPSTPIS